MAPGVSPCMAQAFKSPEKASQFASASRGKDGGAVGGGDEGGGESGSNAAGAGGGGDRGTVVGSRAGSSGCWGGVDCTWRPRSIGSASSAGMLQGKPNAAARTSTRCGVRGSMAAIASALGLVVTSAVASDSGIPGVGAAPANSAPKSAFGRAGDSAAAGGIPNANGSLPTSASPRQLQLRASVGSLTFCGVCASAMLPSVGAAGAAAYNTFAGSSGRPFAPSPPRPSGGRPESAAASEKGAAGMLRLARPGVA
mmetsp:Transcript_85651/g.277423  ORF Transcript_85651/g.277423 Transcript_85651/m.277423 type:complete len:254 (+) Transcript_85651:933-1694(+)